MSFVTKTFLRSFLSLCGWPKILGAMRQGSCLVALGAAAFLSTQPALAGVSAVPDTLVGDEASRFFSGLLAIGVSPVTSGARQTLHVDNLQCQAGGSGFYCWAFVNGAQLSPGVRAEPAVYSSLLRILEAHQAGQSAGRAEVTVANQIDCQQSVGTPTPLTTCALIVDKAGPGF